MPFSLFHNRNFTVINIVASLVSVAILGFFLPYTIYLQSVLGYSAIKAGLILAPMSLIALLLAVFLVQQRGRQSAEPLVPFSLFANRNFSVLNVVAFLVSVGIIGFFLPITIYLQSVLGYSAIKAGLILAPMSLIALLLAPIAGKMSDRIGGKYILMTGLTLFGLGAAVLTGQSTTDSHWLDFMPAIAVMGLGMGGIWAPMATEAMRGVPPRLAGAASGLNNTIRQVGSVIGSAAVGALLQHQLAASLQDEATTRAGQLPAAYREDFVGGFARAARGGLEVGAGQSGAAQNLPSGLPAAVVAQIHRLSTEVFQAGFVRAMHVSLVFPVTVIAAASLACLAMRRYQAPKAPTPQEPAVGATAA